MCKTYRFVIMLFYLLAFVGLAATGTFAQCTLKSGTSINETWTHAASPYFIVCNILVAGLTIEPGVRVVFNGNYVFEVAGVLTAIGTQSDSIRFTKADTSLGWGGIYFNNSAPGSQLVFCVIERSRNRGITINNSSPLIRHSAISSNSVSGSTALGAGIQTNTRLRLEGCILSGNVSSAIAQGGGAIGTSKGGGIFSSAPLVLENCTISNNSVSAVANGTCPIGGAIAIGQGGGIYASDSLTITASIITSNHITTSATGGEGQSATSLGGGIYRIGNSCVLLNSIISYNTIEATRSEFCTIPPPVTRNGGGIFSSSGPMTITNCNIAYNQLGITQSGGTLLVKNSIVYFNTPDTSQISRNAIVTYSNVQRGFPGTGNIDQNPIFLSTSILQIVLGSPCVDAGDPNPAFNDACVPPGLGTIRNDMGAHGGPGNCGWIITDVKEVYSNRPLQHYLTQNYPNPFNPTTKINFSIPSTSFTTLKVFDILGKEVATLVDEELKPGSYETTFSAKGGSASGGDGKDLSSGVYFYRLSAGSFVETKKLLLLR